MTCEDWDMGSDIDEFIRRFGTYDPGASLRNYRDAMAEVLDSDSEEDRIRAAKELSEVLNWTEQPVNDEAVAQSAQEQRQEIEQVLRAAKYSTARIKKILRTPSETKHRAPGRPRTKAGDAVFGLYLRLRGRSWREIVLEIEGSCKERGCLYVCRDCGDVARSTTTAADPERTLKPHCPKCHLLIRPAERREPVCYRCADRMSNLVGRLETFMRERDLIPDLQGFVLQRADSSPEE